MVLRNLQLGNGMLEATDQRANDPVHVEGRGSNDRHGAGNDPDQVAVGRQREHEQSGKHNPTDNHPERHAHLVRLMVPVRNGRLRVSGNDGDGQRSTPFLRGLFRFSATRG